jgi:predicted PurR-regulated permease PerM
MKTEYLITAFFLLVIAIFFYLFYRLMSPFFIPIAWAAVLVIIFYPAYKRLRTKFKSANLSSVVACILIFIIIIGPAVYVLASLVDEASNAVRHLNEFYREGKLDQLMSLDIPFLNAIKERLADYPELQEIDVETIIKDAIVKFSRAIGSTATSVLANITITIFQFFLVFFTMFFFFRDGDRIIAFLKRITPLKSNQIEPLYGHLHGVIQAMMYGGVVIALLQGLLCGLLFFFAGIPSPVMWGTVMAILAFIPVLGPYLVYVPTGMVLIFTGSPITGVIVIAVGILISQLDNVLRPLMFKGRSKTHTLVLFFSIMGGIAMFGLLGIILGPLISAMFLTLLKLCEMQLHPDEPVVLITQGPDRKSEN